MAKKQLIITENTGGGALATLPDRPIMPVADEGQVRIARVAMYQGTAFEEAEYGSLGLKRGDFFDTLEGAKLGTAIQLVVVEAWKTWVKWTEGKQAPDYIVKSKAEVPKGDLDSVDGKRPAAVETITAVVVVAGQAWPAVFAFKRTGLRCWYRTIAPMIERRGWCLFELSSKDDKNPQGQPYKRLTARYVGDVPEDMRAIVTTTVAALRNSETRAKAEAVASDAKPEGDATEPETDIPF